MSDREQQLKALDKQHVWHPFTQMQQWTAGDPLMIDRGEGNYLIDTSGRRYLDGVSSLWVIVHGHNRDEINGAIRSQLERIAHSTLLGLANVPSTELAARLAEIAPGDLNRVFYSDSGSTAVEIALKQAFQYWQLHGKTSKRLLVHLEHSYHGDTLGAVAVGGIDLFHQIFGPLIIDTLAIPSPHLYRHPTAKTPDEAREQALAAARELFAERGHEIAALIVEPLMQGAAGMYSQPPGYLKGLAALCKEFEILLIADEVATGFGRTGTMFACEHEDVVPDLLCLAKGITGGYLPLAATLATEEVYSAFLGEHTDYKAFYHGHTYTGNPVACAAALASLDLFQSDRVFEVLPGKIALLERLLGGQVSGLPHVGDVRQCGLMVGIELVAERATQTAFPGERRMAARVCERARAHGVIVRNLGDVVVLMPPLSATDEDLELLVKAVAQSIANVCE
ncbi:adenosylmethionine--8-amino-7-oxononanoate transaminase [Haliangium ochraceum]|uniref:Adenosylmethionine-8-amino-7-oxononanoate aminotransferase n=1 Tax=Haliangium ochraceum (strain DSM 14365 / JCM 11303 / SMP-2) TaxID=502025 RepID=D0LVN8_HALO1|nr:adenosylmethionine--8-amino-7-oxononanoate transaminase [Haliangium ochraceum]ACY19356.1 adenosylmethionine-8-amino-7-oxononanoateaminotr ansferase [Haliangium ochraceum DSM 14365]